MFPIVWKNGCLSGQLIGADQALQEDGRLILAGPYPAIDSPDPGPAGFSGSLIVAEFESLEAAQGWAGEDPYALQAFTRR